MKSTQVLAIILSLLGIIIGCILLASMSGCNHRAGTLTRYQEGELIERVHFKHTMILYWSKEHNLTASYHTNDTLIDVGVGRSESKSDPNSIKAFGGAAGSVLREVVR